MRERAGFPLDQNLDGIVVRGRGVGLGRGESGRESPPHELLSQVDVLGESAQHVHLHRGPLVSGPRGVRRDPVGRRGERDRTLGSAGGVALVVVVHGHVSEHVVPEGSVLRGGLLRILTGTATGRLLVVQRGPVARAEESRAFELDQVHRRAVHIPGVRRQHLSDRGRIDAFKRALQRLLLGVVGTPLRGRSACASHANHRDMPRQSRAPSRFPPPGLSSSLFPLLTRASSSRVSLCGARDGGTEENAIAFE